jgi:outer membrane receptor protein involved in Fe transport
MNNLSTKLSTVAAFVLAAVTHSTWANEPEQESKKDVETITITGSHLKGVDLEGAQPLISITAEDIKDSGASTISELMKNIGATRGGTGSFNTSTSGAGSNDSPAGMAAASLRGLGASSTLTLVNGRRIAASSFASGNANFVDVNSIPLAAIERIEVLATGASATYGADAVAGVINYILKEDYEGAALDINFGDSEADTNDQKLSLNFVYGMEVGDGGNLTIFADYYKRNDFTYADREITETTFSPTTRSTHATLNYRDSYSGYNEVDSSCPTELQKIDPIYGDAYCAFDPNPFIQINPEFESISGGFVLNSPLNDSTNFFSELLFSSTESNATSGSVSYSDMSNRSRVWVPTNHPNFPQAWTDEYGDDLPYDVRISGRFHEQRKLDITTDSLRFIAGLDGDLGDWFYEFAINYSISESDQVASGGVYNRAKFNAALFGELCVDGSTDCAPGDGGIWFNPFDNQSGNEQVLLLIQERPDRKGKSEVLGFDFKLNGEIYNIPVVFGLEGRTEEISDTPSDIAVAQIENDYIVDVMGFGSSKVSASRDQIAAFAEANIELADGVDLTTALRYDHYSDFDSSFNPKLGLRWEASDNLLIRGSWATSFRAPSLSQAGAEIRTTSFTARCLEPYADAFCGSSAEINPNSLEVGNSDLQAEEAQSANIGFVFSPNRDITLTVDYWQYEHEKIIDVDAEGFLTQAYNNPENYMFCGLVPEGEIGLSVWSGYCAGDTMTKQELADFEEMGRDDLFDADHILRLENIGEQTTRGIDVTYTQYIDISDDSSLRIAADVTHIMEFTRTRTALAEEEELAGSFRYPETIASLGVRWSMDDLTLGSTAYFTSGYEDEMFTLSDFDLLYMEEEQGLKLYEEDSDGNLVAFDRDVDSWLTFDVYMSYRFSDNLRARLTINNVTDEEPPFVYGGYRQVDFINHDSMGRYYNLGIELDF